MKLKHLLLLLMTVVSFSATRAADEWKDVKFNPDVRYSKLVLDSRLGDFYGNTNTMGFATYNQDLSEKKGFPTWSSSKGILIDYVAGLVAKAAVEATILYQDYDWSKPWFKSVESYANHERVSVPTGGGSLDDLNAAKMYFGLYTLATTNDDFAKIAASTTVSNAKTQLEHAMSGLTAHNGGNAFASGTKLGNNDISGGWFHKSIYENQMWLDGQYMGPALLAELINDKKTYTAITADDWGLVAKQFTIVWNQCWDDKEKLLYHAFTSVANKTWAEDGEVWTTRKTDTSNWTGMTAGGHSAAFWGRAEGWYLLALVDVLEQMPTSNSNYTTLKGYLNTLAAGIAARQDATTGCWYQLVGKPGNYTAQYYNGDGPTTVTNYLESSCTAIFAAAYLKGARLGLFVDNGTDNNAKYKEIGEKAYAGLVNQFMKQRTDGTVDLFGCCRSAGLGTDALKAEKFRDGSNAYYLHGYDIIPTPQPYKGKDGHYTEGKVLGAFILAATEYERINHKEHPVLLTLDTPKECTLDGKTALEVAVNGNGNEIYQWYEKTTGPISVATSATYTPTTSGTYYCEITVPATSSSAKGRIAARAAGYTLTSSETNVTVTAETGDGTFSTATISWRDMCTGENTPEKAGVSTAASVTANTGVINGLSLHKETLTVNSIVYKRYSGFAGEENKAKYFEYSYNDNDGIFTPTKISVTWVPNGSGNIKLNVYAVGSDNEKEPVLLGTLSHTKETLATDDIKEISNSDFKKIRIVPYGKDGGSVVLNGVEITGTVENPPLTFDKGTLTGRTLTVIHEPADAGKENCTVVITPESGSSCSCETLPSGVTKTSDETGKITLTYTAPAAGSPISIPVTATVASKSYDYTILIKTIKSSGLVYTKACGYNNGTWTPAAVGTTIELSKLVTSSSTGAYTITSGNDVATLSADGTTLTAQKGGTITLTQAADGEYASGSVDINIAIGSNVAKNGTNAYTVEKDKVYSDGLTVTREDITMTLGNDGFWAKGTAYTAGQNTPKPNSGNIPTSGTYYKFRPTKNGTLAVNVYIGTTTIKNEDGSTTQQLRPLYVSENGTAIEAKAGSYTVGKGETPAATEAYQGDVTFAVKENTDYYVYVNGSKMRLYGFEFKSANSNATFTYDKSALTFTKVEGAENTYEATLEVGADKKGQDLSITLSAAAGATVKLGETAVSGNTVTVTAPNEVATPAKYTISVTSADGTSTTIYKITVKLKKTAITLKYEPAEWNWDKLTEKTQPGNLPVLKAYNASGEIITLPSGITYESDMPSVATVDKDNGTITPKGNTLGRAYIYATFAESDEYEAAETRCSIFIRDGYTYNVTSEGAEYKPGINTFKYITTTNDTSGKTGTQLLRMKFGGWKWNGGEYVKPSICKGTDWQSKDADGKNYVTDSWGTAISSGVDPIDGFTAGFSGKNDACNESMSAEKHYKKTRYGWFKAPSDNDNNLHDPNNITVTYPFTLPVRGAYMTFEPMVNGTLSVFVVQNGAWNTWDKNSSNPHTYVHELDDVVQKEYTIDHTFNKGDIKLGEFRPHSFQVVNQRGLTLSQFATKWSVDTKQDVTATNPVTGNKLYCNPKEKGQDPFSDNVALWPEFKDGRLTDGEQKDIAEAWAGGPRGHQKIVMLHDGSFLAVQKCIVKYTFHVTGHETYYFFSNFSKMGFCGANFTPDPDTAQPTATLELNDQVAYPTVKATETGEYYDGNSQMPTFGGKELPKIKKHTFTVTKADGTKIDGVNVEGVQAPQFKTITVQRDFKQGQWTTLTLPFNMTQKKVEEVFGVGTELLLLKSSEMNGSAVRLHFIYHEIQNVLPGYPYLIKPTLKDADGNNYSNGTTDASTIVETDGALVLTSFNVPVKHITQAAKQLTFGESGPYILKGVEKYCTPEATDKFPFSVNLKEGDVFLSDSNGKFYVSKGKSYCKGYRAYMTTADPQVTPAKSVILTYSGVEDNPDNGTATEISIAELSPDAVMTLGLKGVYNLSGQKVADTADNLPAGIYVVNGQKIVVK